MLKGLSRGKATVKGAGGVAGLGSAPQVMARSTLTRAMSGPWFSPQPYPVPAGGSSLVLLMQILILQVRFSLAVIRNPSRRILKISIG